MQVSCLLQMPLSTRNTSVDRLRYEIPRSPLDVVRHNHSFATKTKQESSRSEDV